MSKFYVVMLATAPYQAFFVWATWWTTYTWLDERRTARAAARAARRSAHKPDPATTDVAPSHLHPGNRNIDTATNNHAEPPDPRALCHGVEHRTRPADEPDHPRRRHCVCG